jgi:hypothetical protein
LDFRLPEYRREVFLRFWTFHLKHRAHPGGVYFAFPALRERYGWDVEESLWFAFLNGNTQHPVTSLILHRICPDPSSHRSLLKMIDHFREYYGQLAFDTDRRHWKKALPEAVESYLRALQRYGGSQAEMWNAAAENGFQGVWNQATALHGFGRLSAFSYAEYLRIMGVPFDCDELFLADRSGSRSHRNGLCLVTGRDEFDWHSSNPGFDGRYPPELIERLEVEAEGLLAEVRKRAVGADWFGDVSFFTLESALCTYKSWHRPNRRYPNVYNDMMYDRLRTYEKRTADAPTEVFWEIRRNWLPRHLRLEDNPYDPGCVPVKQNWYRATGQVIMMSKDDPVFANDFDEAVLMESFGLRRDLRGAR